MTVKEPESDGRCALCGRTRPLTYHHLIPRKCHTKKWFKKRFSRAEMREQGVDLCAHCHRHIHTLFMEKELGRQLNTLEALRADEQIGRFVSWVRRRP
jgi:hypothetical protein